MKKNISIVAMAVVGVNLVVTNVVVRRMKAVLEKRLESAIYENCDWDIKSETVQQRALEGALNSLE